MTASPRTCFQKMWEQHVVARIDDYTDLLHIDRVLLHELTGSITFQQLRETETQPKSPSSIFSVADHLVATDPGRTPDQSHAKSGSALIRLSREASRRHGICFIGAEDPRHGITHVIAPELGIALPGLSIVCSDSHTCTLGSIGALAWGIGSTECKSVVVTHTLLQARPRTMRVRIEGRLATGVAVKDIVLHLAGLIGAKGGDGYAIEFAGSAVRSMCVEQRLTLCNMTIEMSSKYGLVAPDDVTFAYLVGRKYAPDGQMWEDAIAYWKRLASDTEACFEREIVVDAADIHPKVTWGISPEHVVDISGAVPMSTDSEHVRARDYIGLASGQALAEVGIDVAYIGSCTNGRLDDLWDAAHILNGRRLADKVVGICVPGSMAVKRAAEAEGLDQIFKQAGFEWHEPGCGFCAYLGNERLRGGASDQYH